MTIYASIGFPSNRRTDDIHDTDRQGAFLLRLPDSCQGIRSLSGLRDCDDKRLLSEQRFPIPEFGGHLDFRRDTGIFFEHIFTDQSGMV